MTAIIHTNKKLKTNRFNTNSNASERVASNVKRVDKTQNTQLKIKEPKIKIKHQYLYHTPQRAKNIENLKRNLKLLHEEYKFVKTRDILSLIKLLEQVIAIQKKCMLDTNEQLFQDLNVYKLILDIRKGEELDYDGDVLDIVTHYLTFKSVDVDHGVRWTRRFDENMNN